MAGFFGLSEFLEADYDHRRSLIAIASVQIFVPAVSILAILIARFVTRRPGTLLSHFLLTANAIYIVVAALNIAYLRERFPDDNVFDLLNALEHENKPLLAAMAFLGAIGGAVYEMTALSALVGRWTWNQFKITPKVRGQGSAFHTAIFFIFAVRISVGSVAAAMITQPTPSQIAKNLGDIFLSPTQRLQAPEVNPSGLVVLQGALQLVVVGYVIRAWGMNGLTTGRVLREPASYKPGVFRLYPRLFRAAAISAFILFLVPISYLVAREILSVTAADCFDNFPYGPNFFDFCLKDTWKAFFMKWDVALMLAQHLPAFIFIKLATIALLVAKGSNPNAETLAGTPNTEASAHLLSNAAAVNVGASPNDSTALELYPYAEIASKPSNNRPNTNGAVVIAAALAI